MAKSPAATLKVKRPSVTGTSLPNMSSFTGAGTAWVNRTEDIFSGERKFYPIALDMLNTAIRMATATKPTTAAMVTMRIGSSAFVNVVMLRSMSFW